MTALRSLNGPSGSGTESGSHPATAIAVRPRTGAQHAHERRLADPRLALHEHQ